MDSIVSVFAGISQARGIHSAAALAWLVYDYALSFEEEVDLIWSSEDTVPKLLYFISRYFGLVVQCTTCANLPGLFCRAGLIWTFISLYILAFCVEFSLMLRVYALYARSRSIFVILSTAFAAETVWVVVLSSIGYADMLRVVTPYPAGWQMKGCFYSSTPVWFRDTWLPLAGFETFLFALMAIKVYSYRPFGEVPILLRVLRDGTIYYLVILVAFLLCTVAANMSNPFLGVTTTVWITAILSFSGAHLLLSIRALAAERRRQEVATPDISENVPAISRGLGIPAAEPLQSPLGLNEHSSRSLQHVSSLPRPVVGRQTQESVYQRLSGNTAWLQDWECT